MNEGEEASAEPRAGAPGPLSALETAPRGGSEGEGEGAQLRMGAQRLVLGAEPLGPAQGPSTGDSFRARPRAARRQRLGVVTFSALLLLVRGALGACHALVWWPAYGPRLRSACCPPRGAAWPFLPQTMRRAPKTPGLKFSPVFCKKQVPQAAYSDRLWVSVVHGSSHNYATNKAST